MDGRHPRAVMQRRQPATEVILGCDELERLAQFDSAEQQRFNSVPQSVLLNQPH